MGKKSKKRKKKFQKVDVITPKPSRIPLWNEHPNWVALGLMILLLLIFYNPVMLSNKTLLPPDTVSSKSFQPFVDDALKRGQYPLWNPYIFGGMPSFASLSRAPYIEPVGTAINLAIRTLRVIVPLTSFTPLFVHYVIFGLFLFLFLRAKKLPPGIALFSSLAVILLPQVVAYSAFGHTTKLTTVLLIPLIFLLIERMLDRRNLLYFSLLGIVIGIQFLRAHIQICFYTQLIIGFYFVYWAVCHVKDGKKWKGVFSGAGMLAGAVVMGFLISLVINLSVWEYAPLSMRGGVGGGLEYDYATNWSFPPSEITTFFIPSFMGFGGSTYWGPMPFTDFPLYFGIIILFLAGFALILNRNRTVWFFTLLAGFALLMSFGKHLPILYGLMFKILPLFNKFRAPKMILIILDLSMVILAAYGLQGIMQFQDDRFKSHMKVVKRYLLGFGGVVVLLFLILLLGKGLYLGWAANARGSAQEAYDLAMTDGLKALFFFSLSAVLVLMALRKKIQLKWLPILLAIILILDFWGVNRRFVRPQPQVTEASYFRKTADVDFLKKQEGQFRILPVEDERLRSHNWYMYYGIQSAYGYQGAKLKVYQELIDAFQMPTGFIRKYIKMHEGQVVFRDAGEVDPKEVDFHGTFLKLMNVRYIVSPYPLPDTTLKIVAVPKIRGRNAVYEFDGALPRVFFPKQILKMSGKESILNTITSAEFDPAVTAVIEQDPPFQIEASDSNTARITEFDLHRIVIHADVKAPSLLVVSEMYYPAGWKVFIDGQEETIFKTNHAFRSVFLQPGTHDIVFSFKPKMFRLGLLISCITFILLVAGVFFGWRLEKRKGTVLPENTEDEIQNS